MTSILVVDDNPEMLETLERIFSFYQFEVLTAENGKVAIDRAKKDNPDIILLDAYMPVMDGFDACRILKSDPETSEIPIVFLTARYIETDKRVAGLELGADDYILKPFNSKELVTRINIILKKNGMMKALKQKNEKLVLTHDQIVAELQEVQNEKHALEEHSFIDSLTGLNNQSYFNSRLKEEFLRSKRYNHTMAVILLDVDAFSRINESLGYQIGDYILMKMANLILMNTRTTDVVARMEDEKFAIILPQTEIAGAETEAKRIRDALQQSEYVEDQLIGLKNLKRRRKNEHKNLTISMGLAIYSEESPVDSEQKLLEICRAQLKQSKAGKAQTR